MTAPQEAPIKAAEAEAVIERAAHVASLGMPLATGLRAAASEADSPRVARALAAVAADLERGRPLSEILPAPRRLPRHWIGLLRATDLAGDAGLVLSQWLENRRTARQHWRQIIGAIAYPALSLVLLVMISVFLAVVVIEPLKYVVLDLGLRVSPSIKAFYWMASTGVWIFLGALAVGAVGLLAVRLVGGAATWSWLVTSAPLIGPLWHWTGVTEMLRYLSLLLERRVALPAALSLVADSVADAYVAQQCRVVARRVEAGSSLTMALIALRTLPLSIVPFVHWGERHGCLAEGLRASAEMLEGRLQVQTGVLVQIVPPLIFLMIGGMIVAMVGAISGVLLPLLKMLM